MALEDSIVSVLERADCPLPRATSAELIARLRDEGYQIVPPTITRVHIIPRGSSHFEHWADEWRLLVQDENRTLKLFGQGNGFHGRQERSKRLAGELLGMMLTTTPEDQGEEHVQELPTAD